MKLFHRQAAKPCAMACVSLSFTAFRPIQKIKIWNMNDICEHNLWYLKIKLICFSVVVGLRLGGYRLRIRVTLHANAEQFFSRRKVGFNARASRKKIKNKWKKIWINFCRYESGKQFIKWLNVGADGRPKSDTDFVFSLRRCSLSLFFRADFSRSITLRKLLIYF